MRPTALERWEKTRAEGKAKFILTRGVLSYGLFMLIMTVLFYRNDLSPSFIGMAVVGWGIAGALYGTIRWYLFEWQYLKATARRVS
ncbi:MAG: hypothetical protein LBQ09_01235 [Acidobacteriaceae bacterium]|jgi:hypothetical protein|nr:hypothetical protein [Acidobacteriaceae bacterium]